MERNSTLWRDIIVKRFNKLAKYFVKLKRREQIKLMIGVNGKPGLCILVRQNLVTDPL